MVTRSRLAILAAALMVVGAAVFFLPSTPPAPSPGPRLHFHEGQRWAYEVDWAAKTSGQIAGAQEATMVSLETHLTGELTLEVLTPRSDGAQLAVSISRLDRFDFSMQGTSAAPELAAVRTAVVGQPAIIELDGRGRVTALAFAPDASPSVRATLRALVLELGITLPEQAVASWQASEPNTLGTLTAQYAATDPLHFTRASSHYLTLDAVPGALTGTESVEGHAQFALDDEGLQSIDEVQHVHYRRAEQHDDALDASWTFLLHRGARLPPGARAALPPTLSPEPLQGTIGDDGLLARRDGRQAREMSSELLALTVERFEHGTRPGHSFLVSAGAYLRLHPEALAGLVAQFSSPTLTVKGRGLALDVMAEAGDAAAQAAMCEALSTAEARETGVSYSQLAQRFTFVRQPSAESIDFLAREAQRARQAGDLEAAQGPVVALGSSVRRLTERGDAALAETANARLLAELAAVRDGTPLQKRGVLAALGNAARPGNLDSILDFAHDPDAQVRDQVASALRTMPSPRATEALLGFAGEGTTALAISAFASLRAQTLTSHDWERIALLARDGRTPPPSDSTLLELVRQHRAEAGGAGREVLQALLARNRGGDDDLAQIIRALLAEG